MLAQIEVDCFGGEMMSELCLQCFLNTWKPDEYDRNHIVMSKDNEFCEGCMDCVPYVECIDMSNKIPTPNIDTFRSCVSHILQSGKKIACVECGGVFMDDDLSFISETGECPYCHKEVMSIWMKG